MSRRKTKTRSSRTRRAATAEVLRIIGGVFRGRKLRRPLHAGTRPMKHRVREAAFNLIGPAVRGKHAIDLFAGSGALGLEALSRGAASATLVELHLVAARSIRENISTLAVQDRATLVVASAFAWFGRGPELPATPWLVFCAPPYDFYVDRHDQMIALVARLIDRAPPESLLLVEANRRFAYADLPHHDAWDVRAYAATNLGLLQVPN